MSDDPVLTRVDGAIATVAINRPQARNGLVPGTGGRICAALKEIAADESIRVVIFRGVGADFCPGADLKAVVATADPDRKADFGAYEVTAILHEMPQVTIAAIRGACAGAGFGWACACDLRVGDDTIRMNTAFLDVGVAGDMAVPWTLPRLVGAGLARDLMFLPRKLDGDEALKLGILQRLWPLDRFEDELAALAARIAGSAPLALPVMKANFIAAEGMSLRDYIAVESETHIRLLRTEDHEEAKAAWVEKRPARFKGR